MKSSCYEDHGSPVRRAREEARRQLPCSGCGSGGEPALRRPRHLSEAWFRDPDTYFGCRRCGQHLAAIQGPAVSRNSEVAIDRIPDPEGTLRAFMTRDPLAAIRIAGSDGGATSFSLRSIMGPPLSGIDFRTRVTIRRPGGASGVVPFAFTRHGLPWVLWQAIEVEDARIPQAGASGNALVDLLELALVEAVFVVAVDPTARWHIRKLEPRPRG